MGNPGIPRLGMMAVAAGVWLFTSAVSRPGMNPVTVTGEKGLGPIAADIDLAPESLLLSPPQQNWPSYNGDYSGRRYSALSQITPANVRELRAQWVFHSSNSDSMEVTPVVVNGVMYITSANDAFALDARTGRVLWHHVRAVTEGLVDDASSHHNRGVAVWHTRVFMETDNAHLLCLDARSGNLVW